MSDSALSKDKNYQTARDIFKEEYHDLIDIWLCNATKNELKGLKIIRAITKHHGQKKFRSSKRPSANEIPQATEAMRNAMRSSYSMEFGNLTSKVSSFNDIFKYSKLSTLPYATVLKSTPLWFIEHWLSLNDKEDFKILMLDALRGFHSVAKIQRYIPISIQKESYDWKTPEPKLSMKLHYPVSTVKLSRKTTTLPPIEKRKSISEDVGRNTISAKDIKDNMNRANKHLISWISGTTLANQSSYHEFFVPHNPKYNKVSKEHYISSSVKLLPDPKIMNN
ncbi:unnamed protein product [Blepharisma stoltei]|uniref:Uncharacterized protein n=1 Tax=Blepharisma stoltei TaxID=1481888 RepID=A0AAU9IFJ6_9CILI|nr:unnamed protein product [Blepharisma stoltei]